MSSGVEVSGAGATGNTIAGNYIGTDVTGTADLGNSLNGVRILFSAANNTIGGTVAGARNVISGNNGNGVVIGITGTTGNQVQGNYIGTDVNGTADLGNSFNGVVIIIGAASNTIGGTASGAANIVAFNGKDGVVLTSSAGTGNAIQRNSLFENTELGIDLGNDGVTANDPGDADGSPNNLQNFPVITSAAIDVSGDLIITYLVDTDPANATYDLTVEFFEADVDDEEGQVFLGSDSYTTTDHSGCGTAPCTKTINLGGGTGLGVSSGDRLVATATDDEGNTSEFSPASIVSVVSVADATDALIDLVESLDINTGTKNSLVSKLENAIQSLENGNEQTAINQLGAFINAVEAQRGKKLTNAEADEFIAQAQRIIDAINATSAPKRRAEFDDEGATLPTAFQLHQNYPNPFNPMTAIRFDLPEAAEVQLVVYDVTGREVAQLVDQPMDAGTHAVTWDASGLPSGTYLYRLTAGAFSQTKAMALLK